VEVAVKYLPTWKNIDKEIGHLQRVATCDHVVKFYGFTATLLPKFKSHHIGIVMQHYFNGSLRSYLADNFAQLNWEDKFGLARDIALGLQCIHDNNLIHRDLNSDNILIDEHGRALVSDFGESSDEGSESSSKGRAGRYLPPEINDSPWMPFMRAGGYILAWFRLLGDLKREIAIFKGGTIASDYTHIRRHTRTTHP
jgi:serine/threonine protein kinase